VILRTGIGGLWLWELCLHGRLFLWFVFLWSSQLWAGDEVQNRNERTFSISQLWPLRFQRLKRGRCGLFLMYGAHSEMNAWPGHFLIDIDHYLKGLKKFCKS
jgi:hypothetical protein